jgi:hypothetical protein
VKRWKPGKMTRKVNSDFKGAVLLIMHENVAAIREICTRAASWVTKTPFQNKSQPDKKAQKK